MVVGGNPHMSHHYMWELEIFQKTLILTNGNGAMENMTVVRTQDINIIQPEHTLSL